MISLKIFLLFGVAFGPVAVQGAGCPRTSKEANKFCASECVPSITCSSNGKECVCDGDCGYSCIKKDLKCPTPKPRKLIHGQRKVNGKKFNSTATFTCDAGYTLSGASVRTCRSGGVWDGVESKCGGLKISANKSLVCLTPQVHNTGLLSKLHQILLF